MAKEMQIGIGDSAGSAKGFIDAWRRAERGEKVHAEQRLTFENLETLLRVLTSARWRLLRTLRAKGPMSIRALAVAEGRDYKNVHTDVRKLEQIDLIAHTQDDKVKVPWDIVEARLRLAA